MNKEELRQSDCYTCLWGYKKYERNYRHEWTGQIHVICWGKGPRGIFINEIVKECDKKVDISPRMEKDGEEVIA